jgi:hypothetical protein
MLNFLLFFYLPFYPTKPQDPTKRNFGVIPRNPNQVSSMQSNPWMESLG